MALHVWLFRGGMFGSMFAGIQRSTFASGRLAPCVEHADDLDRETFDGNGLADDGPIAAEAAQPEVVPEERRRAAFPGGCPRV